MLQFESDQARESLQLAHQFSGDLIQNGTVVSCTRKFLQVEGFPFAVGTGAKVISVGCSPVFAEVVAVNRSQASLALLESNVRIPIGAQVKRVADLDQVSVGVSLLGRVIDGLGRPLDNGSPPFPSENWPLNGKTVNALRRGEVSEPIDLGVRAINGLLLMGRGQRMALIAGSGVGKSVLLKQLTKNSNADVVVIGLVGERAREIGDFVSALKDKGMLGRTVTVAVPADHSPLLRIKAAQRATAIAEYFRDRGDNVLLLIDSLTRVAHAQREIGLAQGEPPTMKGYPPSAIAMIPEIIERAGNDTDSGGSITAIYSVLADGDDEHDPIVDAVRAITDGHIILSRHLAEQGVFPAINIGKSISRIANKLMSVEHLTAMQKYRSLWARYEDNRDLISMGAYKEGADPLLDEAIASHADQLDYIRQFENTSDDLAGSVATLIERFGQ